MLILAVSACLLGDPVRYDGRSKPEPDLLAETRFRFVPVCPECGCGMPVPRPPIHLRGGSLTDVATGFAWSETMTRFAAAEILRLRTLGIAGAVLKSRSPSCGVNDTPVFDAAGTRQTGTGSGFFTAQLREWWPALPVIDEIGWRDPEKRAEFISAACIFRRL